LHEHVHRGLCRVDRHRRRRHRDRRSMFPMTITGFARGKASDPEETAEKRGIGGGLTPTVQVTKPTTPPMGGNSAISYSLLRARILNISATLRHASLGVWGPLPPQVPRRRLRRRGALGCRRRRRYSV